MTATADQWITTGVTGTATDAGIRLFCLAHAGGGTSLFRPWRALGPGIDVHPVLLPGRESRLHEPPVHRIEQLIEPLYDAISGYLDRPYAFFGHSMGAIVAYEMARRFSGGPFGDPLCLMVSGRCAPHLQSTRPQFSALSDPEFVDALRDLNGTPTEIFDEPELLELFLPALRADFELNELYRPLPGPVLSCPVTAYVGADDPKVNRAELAHWHETTAGPFTLRAFDGDHFYLKGGRSDVLRAIEDDLRRCGAPRREA
ncbi:thioesterase II family protein [Streptomyces sp. NPDC002004]